VKQLLALLALVLAVAAIGACGEDDTPERDVPGGADPADVAVIDAWVTRLREGDVEAAAELFAIPSVAENGPALIEIEDVDDARLFNASLPCGAVLIGAETEGDFTIATFRLTERPGAGTCGSGTGAAAQTAFVVEEGLITEWRRVAPGVDEPPSTSA
jgi:hypothetical protein